jgi:hypothetical protein
MQGEQTDGPPRSSFGGNGPSGETPEVFLLQAHLHDIHAILRKQGKENLDLKFQLSKAQGELSVLRKELQRSRDETSRLHEDLGSRKATLQIELDQRDAAHQSEIAELQATIAELKQQFEVTVLKQARDDQRTLEGTLQGTLALREMELAHALDREKEALKRLQREKEDKEKEAINKEKLLKEKDKALQQLVAETDKLFSELEARRWELKQSIEEKREAKSQIRILEGQVSWLQDNNDALLRSLEHSVHHDASAALEAQSTVQINAMQEERDEALQQLEQSNMLASGLMQEVRLWRDHIPSRAGTPNGVEAGFSLSEVADGAGARGRHAGVTADDYYSAAHVRSGRRIFNGTDNIEVGLLKDRQEHGQNFQDSLAASPTMSYTILREKTQSPLCRSPSSVTFSGSDPPVMQHMPPTHTRLPNPKSPLSVLGYFGAQINKAERPVDWTKHGWLKGSFDDFNSRVANKVERPIDIDFRTKHTSAKGSFDEFNSRMDSRLKRAPSPTVRLKLE